MWPNCSHFSFYVQFVAYGLHWLLLIKLKACLHCMYVLIYVQTVICISIFCKLYQQKSTQRSRRLTHISMLLQKTCVYLQNSWYVLATHAGWGKNRGHWPVWVKNVPQCSGASRVRCGGLFSDEFNTNLLLSLTVKVFENYLTFRQIAHKSVLTPFLLTVVNGPFLWHSVFIYF